MPGSSVVLTGGCGFIGSHLATRLLNEGVGRLTVLDDLSTGTLEALAQLPSKRLQFVSGELSSLDDEALAALLDGADYLFHLAARKHRSTAPDPMPTLAANVMGTHRLWLAARRQGVRKAVFTSSIFAYGRWHGPPMTEDLPAQPDTVYGISKLTGELLLRQSGLPGISLRLFFVYGPGQFRGAGYRSVIVKSCELLLRGQAPVVYGDGLQALDYVYIDDVVEALLLALNSPLQAGEVLNIGSGEPTRVLDLVQNIVELAGQPVALEFGEPDETAGSWRVADLTRSHEALGWSPRVPLREGLGRTYSWMRGRQP